MVVNAGARGLRSPLDISRRIVGRTVERQRIRNCRGGEAGGERSES